MKISLCYGHTAMLCNKEQKQTSVIYVTVPTENYNKLKRIINAEIKFSVGTDNVCSQVAAQL